MRNLTVVASFAVIAFTACDDSGTSPVDGGTPDAPGQGPLVVGGDRPIDVQQPAEIVAGQRYPLFLILHGYGASGLLQQSYMQLGQLTTLPGAFVLAPDGLVDANGKQYWNASPACCDFGNSDVDDVAYLGGMIDEMIAGWPIDPARVFVIGHSNGGFMAFRLACERADVITGIADLAGANISADGAGCAPTANVNVLHIHGTSDAVVNYAGGTLNGGQVTFPGAMASTSQWAANDGCSATTTAGATLDLANAIAGAETTPAAFDDCPAGGAVELWTMAGGSHVPTFTDAFAPTVVGWLMAHPRP